MAGINIRHFKACGAAYVHELHDDTRLHLWPTNYSKLACSTMFTLFFGGDIFAPEAKYEGKSLQQFLQGHFIDCFKYLATYAYS